MGKCEFHDEVFKRLGQDISKIDKKLDKLIDTNIKLDYLKKDFEAHKNNGIIHISKWWILASVLGTIIATVINLKF